TRRRHALSRRRMGLRRRLERLECRRRRAPADGPRRAFLTARLRARLRSAGVPGISRVKPRHAAQLHAVEELVLAAEALFDVGYDLRDLAACQAAWMQLVVVERARGLSLAAHISFLRHTMQRLRPLRGVPADPIWDNALATQRTPGATWFRRGC